MPTLVQSDKTVHGPLRLSGLRQAIYVLQCLQKGQTEKEIIGMFEGDSQLVDMWISFLRHNHWMESQRTDGGDYGWIVTDKGKDWIARFGISPQSDRMILVLAQVAVFS